MCVCALSVCNEGKRNSVSEPLGLVWRTLVEAGQIPGVSRRAYARDRRTTVRYRFKRMCTDVCDATQIQSCILSCFLFFSSM